MALTRDYSSFVEAARHKGYSPEEIKSAILKAETGSSERSEPSNWAAGAAKFLAPSLYSTISDLPRNIAEGTTPMDQALSGVNAPTTIGRLQQIPGALANSVAGEIRRDFKPGAEIASYVLPGTKLVPGSSIAKRGIVRGLEGAVRGEIINAASPGTQTIEDFVHNAPGAGTVGALLSAGMEIGPDVARAFNKNVLQKIPGVSTFENILSSTGQSIKSFFSNRKEVAGNTLLNVSREREIAALKQKGYDHIGADLADDVNSGRLVGHDLEEFYSSVQAAKEKAGKELGAAVSESTDKINLVDFKKSDVYQKTIATLKKSGANPAEYQAQVDKIIAGNGKMLKLVDGQAAKEALDDILFPTDALKERVDALSNETVKATSDVSNYLRSNLRSKIGDEFYDQYEKLSLYDKLIGRQLKPMQLPKNAFSSFVGAIPHVARNPAFLLRELEKPQDFVTGGMKLIDQLPYKDQLLKAARDVIQRTALVKGVGGTIAQ